jgi:small conductance mechanosensitive channel
VEHAFAVTAKSVTIMVDGFFALLPNIIIGIVVFVVFLQVANLVKRLVGALGARAGLDPTLCQALGSLSSFATTIFGMLVVAAIIIPSFKPGNLIAGLGITSVAIGFAFKDILQNFFAGLLLLWQKPFRIGDQIKTQGFEGTVEQIDIRSTRIVTHSGELVVLPNDNIWTNPIIVSTAFDKRRVQLAVTVPAALAVDKARALIVRAMAETPDVMKNPEPKVYISTLDAGDTKFEIFFWTKPKEQEVLITTDKVASEIKVGIARLATEMADESAKAAAETSAKSAVETSAKTAVETPVKAAEISQKAAAEPLVTTSVVAPVNAAAEAPVSSSAENPPKTTDGAVKPSVGETARGSVSAAV